MHSVLLISELQLRILSYFSMPLPSWNPSILPLGHPNYETNDRPDLFHLACTNKMFFEVVIPRLWSFLPDIRALLRLIPQFARRPESEWELLKPSREDLERFLIYNSYVRVLAWDPMAFWNTEPKKIWFDRIASVLWNDELLSPYLLPNLQEFHMVSQHGVIVGKNMGKNLLHFHGRLAPFHSLKTLTLHKGFSHSNLTLEPLRVNKLYFGLQHDGCPDFMRISRYSVAWELGHRPPRKPKFVFWPDNLMQLPHLTHLYTRNFITLEFAEQFQKLQPSLEALHCENGEEGALFNILYAVESSLKWLRISEVVLTSLRFQPWAGRDWKPSKHPPRFENLQELYLDFSFGRPGRGSFEQLWDLIFTDPLPNLRALGLVYDENQRGLRNMYPETIPLLLEALSARNPTLCSQITFLSLRTNMCNFKDFGPGNQIISIFPNLHALVLRPFSDPSTKLRYGIQHSNLRELRIVKPRFTPSFISLLKKDGWLRKLLPKLEEVVLPLVCEPLISELVEELGGREATGLRFGIWTGLVLDDACNFSDHHFETLTACFDA
ncbi:hypothetical protein DL96DRAFT_1822979 [Flagelloscypha sp. PMI_526]|nr:hypothetical protein DL96DRAFT_1822979 [Flagelloscypha sp. PMI_526]